MVALPDIVLIPTSVGALPLKYMPVKLAQEEKVELSKRLMPLPIMAAVKLLQPENTLLPRLVTLSGMVTLVRRLH